jgi:hypothetical protein
MQHQELTQEQKMKADALVKIVRDSTEHFKGLHYVNEAFVNGGEINATHPQIVIYEPSRPPDGSHACTNAGVGILRNLKRWRSTYEEAMHPNPAEASAAKPSNRWPSNLHRAYVEHVMELLGAPLNAIEATGSQPLSERELKVLRIMAEGLANRAPRQSLAPAT